MTWIRHMKRIILYILSVFLLVSCEESGRDPNSENNAVDADGVKRAVLVYAVNRSSLSHDFVDDSNEMLEAMLKVDAKTCQLLVFRTDDEENCGLYRAVRSSGGGDRRFEFRLLKRFDRDVLSTHPDRIKEVVDYALSIFPHATYDLIFWGHGMSWKPFFTDHNVVSPPEVYGYGGEYNGNGSRTDWVEIDELAASIPPYKFETIWFDCCYMSGIETIYQLRDKCKTFVGYPSEVWQYGMAYDQVLPYLLRENPDVVAAAKAFYEFYAKSADPVTVAVTDMSNIESLADVAKEILLSGETMPSTVELVNYSRTSGVPFYDFKQFYGSIARLNGRPDLEERLSDAMDEAVIYHAQSDKNFWLKPWETANISGISAHYYLGTDSRDETYYRTLDWYHRVYE